MLIDLPEHDVSRRLTIAGWMLFPRPEDDDLRRLYRSAIQHIRVMRILKDAGQPIDPASQKYKWVKSGDELVAIEQDISKLAVSESRSALIGSPEKIVEFFDDYENLLRCANIDLLFRKGIVSGLILLACCAFQTKSVRRYGDGKAGAQKAVVGMAGIGLTLVREYFKDFASVAHLWASWLLRISSASDLGVHREIFNGMENRIPTDFMVNVDINDMLGIAKSALAFGRGEINTGITILGGVDAIEFDWLENSPSLMDALPANLVEIFEQFRPESKLKR
ncbi:hypothetical protein [Trinickia mobilis]|uniref:hypothetical protein n=1 Tax=Trinickia mobilis TaxID=2816356 RepID=UPI001A8F1360|nr:hypothetical protein [Trinickia mobilis]